jgi:hypothetical protein
MRYCREFTQPATVEGSGEHLGLGFDLDPPAGIEKTLHHNQGSRRINVTEELTMGATDGIPIGRVDRVNSGPNHVFTRPTEGLDRLEDDLEASCGLHVGVTLDRFAVTVEGRRSGDRDVRSPAYGTRKAEQALVRGRGAMVPRTRRTVLFLHVGSLYADARPGQDKITTGCGAGSKPVACDQWKYPATPPVSRRERSTYRW